MTKQPTIPSHIADLDADDQALWLAWQDCGGSEESTIDEAKEALMGIYRDEKEAGQAIGEEILSNEEKALPWWLSVDWEATWECNLRHDFSSTTIDGQFYVFRA